MDIKNYIKNNQNKLPLGAFKWDIAEYKKSKGYVNSNNHHTDCYAPYAFYKLFRPY